MHEHGFGLLSLQHVDHGWQLVIVERDLRGDVLGFGARIGNAHCNEFADLPDLVGYQRRLLGRLEAGKRRHRPQRPHIGEVLRRKDAIAQVIGNDDRFQLRVGNRTTNKGDFAHPREPQITDVLSLAVEKPLVLFSFDSSADARLCQGSHPAHLNFSADLASEKYHRSKHSTR